MQSNRKNSKTIYSADSARSLFSSLAFFKIISFLCISSLQSKQPKKTLDPMQQNSLQQSIAIQAVQPYTKNILQQMVVQYQYQQTVCSSSSFLKHSLSKTD